MPWMVDQRHYLDVLDPVKAEQIPAPARRIAAFMGAVVEGVTAGWDDPTEGCAVTARCIGKVGRRRCTDRVVARIRPEGDIEWTCLSCGDFGHIHHWQETPWNLTASGNRLFPKLDEVAELEMTLAEYEAVATIPMLDAPARRVLAAGRVPWDLVVIEAPRAWLEHLVEFVASEANHTRSRRKAALYEAVLDRARGIL
jgi:hypothetical protein